MNEQQERSAFERWYEGHCLPGEADWFRRDADDPSEYDHGHTSEAWAGWQARAALAANVPADLIDAARKVVREALDSVAVHPCDENNDTVRARGLIGPVSELHAVMLAAAPACTCPSGDGSLRWPCPEHPAPAPEAALPNGLTEAETSASPSVAGLTAPAQAQQSKGDPKLLAILNAPMTLQEAYGEGWCDRKQFKNFDEAWQQSTARYKAEAKPEAQQPLTADDLKEPKNGAAWRVEWWNESARLMLPAGSKLDRFNSYRNGTLVFTIKRIGASGEASND